MLFVISCFKFKILVESEYMDYYTAKFIIRQRYPIYSFIFPVRFKCISG